MDRKSSLRGSGAELGANRRKAPAAGVRGSGDAALRHPVMQLAQSAGNRAAIRWLQAARPSPSAAPIQRARFNIRRDGAKAGTISGVSQWPKRPTSNLRGMQGQHLTAFVVFQDMIISNVADRTPKEAAKSLIGVLDSFYALPGMQQRNVDYLKEAIQQAKDTLSQADGDPAIIGGVIDDILSIRNKVPGTAERGVGGGHGEAKNAGTAEAVERLLRRGKPDEELGDDQEAIAKDVCYAMWRLLDYDPKEPDSEAKTQDIVNKLLTHFLTLRVAYPLTFQWLTDIDCWLFPYLAKNRDKPGMPLSQIPNKTLEKLAQEVYKGL